jgi:hypothetical protein
MITDKQYMKIGITLIKLAVVCFLVGIFVGWLIFKL